MVEVSKPVYGSFYLYYSKDGGHAHKPVRVKYVKPVGKTKALIELISGAQKAVNFTSLEPEVISTAGARSL